jgi:methyl-accepting chemotaxis protein
MASITERPGAADVRKLSWLDTFASWLPKGGTLSDAEWAARHRVISMILWLHVPLIAGVGIFNTRRPIEVLVDTGAIALCAALAAGITGRAAKSNVVSLGLLLSSGALVHLTGGLTVSHFHFFVMLGLVALYQQWYPYLQSVAFVVLHHTILGMVWPEAVFTSGEEQRRPFLWAVIHATFILGQIGVQVTVWKFIEVRVAQFVLERAEWRAASAEEALDKEKRRLEELRDTVYKLSHWRDLESAAPLPKRASRRE